MNLPEKRYYEFGPFRLDVAEGQLLRAGQEIPLTPKAFQLLQMLVQNRGHVLDKEALMQHVWADTVVEEKNLADNISILRKVLGDDPKEPRYIKTVPRRGYRFVADVREVREEAMAFVEHTKARIVVEEETGQPAHTLESIAANPHARVAPALPSPALRRRGRRETTLLVGVLLVCAILFVGTGVAVLAWRTISKNSTADQNRKRSAAPNNEAEESLKITRVTNSGIAWCASVSPDGRFVVYGENHPYGAGTLYLKQLGTNHEVRLLEPGERVFYATAFSPDGSFIYYTATEKNDPEPSLYRVPVLGGVPTPLFPNIWFFSLSPDGAQVAFYREAPDRKATSIIVAALDGSGERTLLTRRRDETALSGSPAFSPDGSLIAFAASVKREAGSTAGSLIFHAADSATGEVRQLSSERFTSVGKMVWMPDDTGLVFIGWRPSLDGQLYFLSYPAGELRRINNDLTSYSHVGLGIAADSSALVADVMERSLGLWVVGADGDAAGATRLTLGHNDAAEGVTSLPDERIAYVARTGEAYDIWTVKGDGTEARPLTADPHFERDPAATPDGRYLVFTSDRAGSNQLFRVNADGTGLTQLSFGPASAHWPDCSPDGRWVVYASSSKGTTTIWKVSIEGGEPVRLTDYEAYAPIYSPDGQLIACVLPATDLKQASVAVIPADGGAPLKTFDALNFRPIARPMRWTPDGRSLVYVKIEKLAYNLWQQPLAGGSPRRLTNFSSDVIHYFTYSRDGKRIILSRGNLTGNVALIKGFK